MSKDNLGPGVYGAKTQSWMNANPRSLLKQIIDQMPNADKQVIFTTFVDVMLEGINKDEMINYDYVVAALGYWFAGNYLSLVAPEPSTTQTRQSRSSREETHVRAVAVAKVAIHEGVKRAAQIMLLDLVMPNGKALRDCNSKDCLTIGSKMGPWLSSLSKKLKGRQTVGDVFTEAQVRKLYSGS